MTNSLTRADYVDLVEGYSQEQNIPILNKLSEETAVLRQNILFSGLEALSYNLNRRQENLKLFEVGKQYSKEEGEYKETDHLSLFMTGIQDSSWIPNRTELIFHDLLQEVLKIIQRFSGAKIESKEVSTGELLKGLQLTINNTLLGVIGWVDPKVAKRFEISVPVLYAKLEWKALVGIKKERLKSKELSYLLYISDKLEKNFLFSCVFHLRVADEFPHSLNKPSAERILSCPLYRVKNSLFLAFNLVLNFALRS
jgi:phenylalanyl-tRNA synthetase beta chain